MQKNILNLTVIFVMAGLLSLSGCGSDDYGSEYTAAVTFNDADEDGTMTLDYHPIAACPTSGDPEIFTDVFANIEMTITDKGSGLTLNGYSIEYIPELSEDGTNTMVMPPALNSLLDWGSNSIYMPSASTSTFTITCFSYDQKQYLNSVIGPAATLPSDLWIARYTVRIILFCTADTGQEIDIQVRRTVYFGPYNNC